MKKLVKKFLLTMPVGISAALPIVALSCNNQQKEDQNLKSFKGDYLKTANVLFNNIVNTAQKWLNIIENDSAANERLNNFFSQNENAKNTVIYVLKSDPESFKNNIVNSNLKQIEQIINGEIQNTYKYFNEVSRITWAINPQFLNGILSTFIRFMPESEEIQQSMKSDFSKLVGYLFYSNGKAEIIKNYILMNESENRANKIKSLTKDATLKNSVDQYLLSNQNVIAEYKKLNDAQNYAYDSITSLSEEKIREMSDEYLKFQKQFMSFREQFNVPYLELTQPESSLNKQFHSLIVPNFAKMPNMNEIGKPILDENGKETYKNQATTYDSLLEKYKKNEEIKALIEKIKAKNLKEKVTIENPSVLNDLTNGKMLPLSISFTTNWNQSFKFGSVIYSKNKQTNSFDKLNLEEKITQGSKLVSSMINDWNADHILKLSLPIEIINYWGVFNPNEANTKINKQSSDENISELTKLTDYISLGFNSVQPIEYKIKEETKDNNKYNLLQIGVVRNSLLGGRHYKDLWDTFFLTPSYEYLIDKNAVKLSEQGVNLNASFDLYITLSDEIYENQIKPLIIDQMSDEELAKVSELKAKISALEDKEITITDDDKEMISKFGYMYRFKDVTDETYPTQAIPVDQIPSTLPQKYLIDAIDNYINVSTKGSEYISSLESEISNYTSRIDTYKKEVIAPAEEKLAASQDEEEKQKLREQIELFKAEVDKLEGQKEEATARLDAAKAEKEKWNIFENNKVEYFKNKLTELNDPKIANPNKNAESDPEQISDPEKSIKYNKEELEKVYTAYETRRAQEFNKLVIGFTFKVID
ncbi:hypothetical protein VBM90_01435 [Mycoplasma sp. 2704]|uniref:hypothetical protein n=1 Tax=Mycoplasma sp. 2704 TaxID=3108529 RepID=UPI002B1DFE62|nr:hypothetical protein [Mycoplasma sp. 2704]MEA4134465.1 hypothetical protein [Mycoplasma sp. 2704]